MTPRNTNVWDRQSVEDRASDRRRLLTARQLQATTGTRVNQTICWLLLVSTCGDGTTRPPAALCAFQGAATFFGWTVKSAASAHSGSEPLAVRALACDCSFSINQAAKRNRSQKAGSASPAALCGLG